MLKNKIKSVIYSISTIVLVKIPNLNNNDNNNKSDKALNFGKVLST